MISQSSLESQIYELCKRIRGKNISGISDILSTEPIALPPLQNSPTLNQQNRNKLKALLALVTEIVAKNSGEPNYMLNKKNIEVEHIWCSHYEQFAGEFSNESDFINVRNNIGDLLLLPKSFNASYGDEAFEVKVEHYYEQNILAQSLNRLKYEHNPGFIEFIRRSGLKFKSLSTFKRSDVLERAELYRNILQWNWEQ